MLFRIVTACALLGVGLAACGDDGGTGGTGGSGSGPGSTGSGPGSTTSTGTGTTTTTSSSSASGSGSAATTTAATTTTASSSSTGAQLQLCGTDNPGGTVEECDPTTQYCTEMNGGIVASQQFACEPIPVGCNGTASCNCISSAGCDCTLDGTMVRITCNFP